MSFPGPCPVNLTELLRALDRPDRFQHLSLIRLPDGRYQAGFKRPDMAGYRVVIEDDMLDAITGALGPVYGHSWSELLGEGKEGCTDHSDALDDENMDLL